MGRARIRERGQVGKCGKLLGRRQGGGHYPKEADNGILSTKHTEDTKGEQEEALFCHPEEYKEGERKKAENSFLSR